MLRVISAGALCTIQDLGRTGYQRFGVPLGGAMDRAACVIANRLVGNPPDAACLEITGPGAAFEVLAPCVIALAGADLGATFRGRALPPWMAHYLAGRGELAFEGRRWGARAYLALAGGIDVPPVLGARSTYLPGEFGGLAGRALRSGDVITAQPAGDLARRVGRIWPTPPDYSPQVRLLPFDGPVPDVLIAHAWRVGTQSNRIGLRLSGPQIEIDQPRARDSFGVFPGVIQLPPDGQPILLTADAQPTGGYPVIAIAIQADLHRVAQVLPGDALRFVPTTFEEAVDAWRRLQALLASPVEEDEGMALAARAGG
jgi:biotin-dependent carboxylase-like uncharacterized protein